MKRSSSDLATTKAKQPAVSSFLQKPISQSQMKSMNEGLMYLVAKDMQPLSVVEDSGFIEYSKRLNPSYSLPSRKTLSAWIGAKARQVKADVKEGLKALHKVSVTCDMWTSRATEGYLTVTAHGISDDFKLINIVLDTVCMHVAHTGDNQADVVMKVLDEWYLKGKVFAVVTDNASSAVRCVTKLIRKGYAEIHIRCSAHTLQLCVNDVLKSSGVVADMLKRCKDTVALFHHSVVLSESMIDTQVRLNCKTRKLKQAVPTRWNSTYEMLVRLVDQQQVVQLALCGYTGKVTTAKRNDFILAKKLIQLLSPFQEATTILSGNSYVTASVVRPVIDHILMELDGMRSQQDEEQGMECSGEEEKDTADAADVTDPGIDETSDGIPEEQATTLVSEHKECQLESLPSLLPRMTETLRDSITDRFQSALHEPLFQVCSYLDPRFKATYEQSTVVIEEVKKEMRKILNSQQNAMEASTSSSESTSPATPNDMDEPTQQHPRSRGPQSFWYSVKAAQESAKATRSITTSDAEARLATYSLLNFLLSTISSVVRLL